jgi:signal transduction histidine kinase
VPVEERALIFERFSRGISAGQRSGSEGAGLGLALVDEHIRLHDGRVWVEDRSDGQQGARFVIELPARMPIDYVPSSAEVEDAEPSPTTSGEP